VVDVLGVLLLVVVHSAGVSDSTGGKVVLEKLFARIKRSVYNGWCRLKLIWADGSYDAIVGWVKQRCGWMLEITRRPADAKGFVVIVRAQDSVNSFERSTSSVEGSRQRELGQADSA
jgi:hypothetical protein